MYCKSSCDCSVMLKPLYVVVMYGVWREVLLQVQVSEMFQVQHLPELFLHRQSKKEP